MALSPHEKDTIIRYRITKAQQTLKEAKDNANLGNWSLAANRLYYSIFYMVMAVNLRDGETAKTHNGTYNLFNRNYIAKGLLTKDEGHLYRNIFSMRQTGDYDDLFDWEAEDIIPIIPKVEALVNKLQGFIDPDKSNI